MTIYPGSAGSLDAGDGRTGISASQEERPAHSRDTVVVISGFSSGALDGVEEVLIKPVALKALLDTIRRYVVKKAARV
jgi:hypothetical protein